MSATTVELSWGAIWGLMSAGATLIVGAATVAFFAFSIDSRVADMQAFDEGWAGQDRAETAMIIGDIEEVRTAQGIMIGRLDGSGGELMYRIGYRDGEASCRP